MKRKTLRVALIDDSFPPVRNYTEPVADGQIKIEPPSTLPAKLDDMGRGGRPMHLPSTYTRRQVEMMVAYGIPQASIAHIIGISIPTLEKHYRNEIDHGAQKANVIAATRLFDIATRGTGKESVTALIFWLKTRAKWVDQRVGVAVDHRVSGSIEHEHTNTDNQLTHEERAARVLQVLGAGGIDGVGPSLIERIRAVVTPAGTTDDSLPLISG